MLIFKFHTYFNWFALELLVFDLKKKNLNTQETRKRKKERFHFTFIPICLYHAINYIAHKKYKASMIHFTYPFFILDFFYTRVEIKDFQNYNNRSTSKIHFIVVVVAEHTFLYVSFALRK